MTALWWKRQGDALAEIIVFAADSGQASVEGGERPHIAVTVSLETLQTGLGRATLDDGRPMSPEQARRLACEAKIIPMVLDTKSNPIDIGESKRLADKRLRRALAIRDKGCAVPGCARTPNPPRHRRGLLETQPSNSTIHETGPLSSLARMFDAPPKTKGDN